ncbi:MAG TPA: phosphate ABC transporter permease subunit PstC [Clostridia bacterium]|nr:phosphate ABC transporter permease subunit PstC [Clostridia bacterium]
MISNKGRKLMERIIETIFLVCAALSILSVIVITIYVFAKGSPAIFKVGAANFLFGTVWQPEANQYGILPMIISSVLGTIGAVIIGVFIGLFTAIFLAELAPKKLAGIIRPAVELLAGIPSVVFGFFGLMVLVPIISEYFGGAGNSLLAVIIILSVMILPTVISMSETSIRAVPSTIKEGSLALGASHIQTIFKVILPAAKSGIMASIVLGTGRAIGETMAVILVSGNTALIPHAITDKVRTMTANIALEMGYANGLHQETLFATGVILFIFIMLLNITLNILLRRRDGEAA